MPATAFNGCKVILCLTGPWQQISECVPDVKEALRCIARGRCWPSCPSAPGVTLAPASPAACPPQYGLYEVDACGRQVMTGCTKNLAIDVAFEGIPSWVRIWTNTGDGSQAVTQYSEPARALYGEHVNLQFDTDYANWLALQPTEPPVTCFEGGH